MRRGMLPIIILPDRDLRIVLHLVPFWILTIWGSVHIEELRCGRYNYRTTFTEHFFRYTTKVLWQCGPAHMGRVSTCQKMDHNSPAAQDNEAACKCLLELDWHGTGSIFRMGSVHCENTHRFDKCQCPKTGQWILHVLTVPLHGGEVLWTIFWCTAYKPWKYVHHGTFTKPRVPFH